MRNGGCAGNRTTKAKLDGRGHRHLYAAHFYVVDEELADAGRADTLAYVGLARHLELEAQVMMPLGHRLHVRVVVVCMLLKSRPFLASASIFGVSIGLS